MKGIELPPCPFCGSVRIEETMRTGHILCLDCGASCPRWQDWNQRTPEAQLDEMRKHRGAAEAEVARLTQENATMASDVASLLKDNTALEDRAIAMTENAEALAANLKNCMEVLPQEDRQMCCSGRECGCYGATIHDEAEHYAKEALAAHAKLMEGK